MSWGKVALDKMCEGQGGQSFANNERMRRGQGEGLGRGVVVLTVAASFLSIPNFWKASSAFSPKAAGRETLSLTVSGERVGRLLISTGRR